MNMQFLSIGNNNGMTVAYFLDRQSNTVYMFRVMDMTGTPPPQDMSGTLTAPAFTPPAGFAPAPFAAPGPVVPTAPVPTGKPPSIMPPGLAKMMREGNEMVYQPGGIQ